MVTNKKMTNNDTEVDLHNESAVLILLKAPTIFKQSLLFFHLVK